MAKALLGFTMLGMSSHSGLSYCHGGWQECKRNKPKLVIPLTVIAPIWHTVISMHIQSVKETHMTKPKANGARKCDSLTVNCGKDGTVIQSPTYAIGFHLASHI